MFSALPFCFDRSALVVLGSEIAGGGNCRNRAKCYILAIDSVEHAGSATDRIIDTVSRKRKRVVTNVADNNVLYSLKIVANLVHKAIIF